jgi:biopolymer transport protein ExbD
MINLPKNSRGNIINDLLPDLTPLMDIVFMLIIFLILSINSPLYSLKINLPQDKDSISKIATDNKTISVYLLPKNQGWKINKKLYLSEEEFRLDLETLAKKDDSIIIISDKNSSVEKLINLFIYLEKKSFNKVSIGVERTAPD